MSFDKPTRNALAKMVSDCRRSLTADIRDQLQGLYGLQPDGSALSIESLHHLDERGRQIAMELRAWQEHLAATEAGPEEKKKAIAFDRLGHETAFTLLNRLSALRMCEERGHVIECVRRGMESDGFVLYERFSGGALGTRGETYRLFLERMFGELAVDLGALFDLRAPQSLLFPRERCLEETLELLNSRDLAHLWKDDETIGWIYQYFNSKEEREAMREASAAPRNSRELAVRNQFFTPRYVVEFLVDNTLGRIWYEMQKEETALKETCRYLVRCPTEMLMDEGQNSPATTETQESLSQDDLLRHPVYIPHRAKKDPRDLKIIDPAVGSGHFLLYAFDLLEIIYQEAWEGRDQPISEITGKTLREEYADLSGLKVAIPGLILRHNLHGIDIDLRACQIAALALWLRAQHSYLSLGLKSSDRPQIARSNIVCAEPMPGEPELLDQFLNSLQPTVIGQLVRVVFEKMKLAGEAGSLLKIEEEIVEVVADAKQKWLAGPKLEQGLLFAGIARTEQRELGFDFSGIADEVFWERAEERIYAALQDYAEQAENGSGYQRRLFADDSARGFAFVDLCRRRYDVALMNPPFGEASLTSREYLYDSIPEAARDLFAGFVSRLNEMLSKRGRLGVLSNRTAFFSDFLASWRIANFLGGKACLGLVADLGYGVLDAVVEAAAYVCEKGEIQNCHFINVLGATNKAELLTKQVGALRDGQNLDSTVMRNLATFYRLPDHRFIYQLDPFWVQKLNLAGENRIFVCKAGLTSGDDTRNLRLFWELTPSVIGGRWRWLAKGGEFSRYRTDMHLLVDWQNKNFLHRLRNSELYGRRGVTYTERTTSNLSARILNEGACFSGPGPGVIPNRAEDLHFLLAYMNSFVATYCTESIVGGGDFSMKGTAARHLEPGYMKHLPEIEVSLSEAGWFRERVNQLIGILECLVQEETDALFTSVFVDSKRSLSDGLTKATRYRFGILQNAYEIVQSLEIRITGLLDLPAERVRDTYSDTGWPWSQNDSLPDLSSSTLLTADPLKPHLMPTEFEGVAGKYRFEMKLSHYLHSGIERHASALDIAPNLICGFLAERAIPSQTALEEYAAGIVSYLLGCVFGRWDMRRVTIEKSPPGLSDPFASLPASSPGTLQSDDGLPMTQEDFRELQSAGRWSYPLDISWDGILADDPDNESEIVRRVREALISVWTTQAEAIEEELCDILAVKDLREYFRKPAAFFADHLGRYSKSRRQAPIYWPLSTASGSYTLWIYYHRLSEDLLYTAVNKYVKPKIEDTEHRLRRFESELGTATGREGSKLRDAFEEATTLLSELGDLRDELLRVAQLPYKPNFDDGVLITACPLGRLFRLPKWRRDLEGCWQSLETGEYDWAHLAYSIWPDRVRSVCKKDRSIAIAHGLDELREVVPRVAKQRKTRKKTTQHFALESEE